MIHHRDGNAVIGTEGDALAPMGVLQTLGVEADEFADEAPKRRLGRSRDVEVHGAEDWVGNLASGNGVYSTNTPISPEPRTRSRSRR